MIPPARIASDSEFAAAWNAEREAVRSHAPLTGPGLLTSHTIHGVHRDPVPDLPPYAQEAVAAAVQAGASVARYRLKTVRKNYLVCRTWDGVTEGATDIFIAKPFKLRHDRTSAVINGVTINYTYPDAANPALRTASEPASGESESQIVVPYWLTNDEIFAITGAPGLNSAAPDAVSAITLLDLNLDGRAWARKAEPT